MNAMIALEICEISAVSKQGLWQPQGKVQPLPPSPLGIKSRAARENLQKLSAFPRSQRLECGLLGNRQVCCLFICLFQAEDFSLRTTRVKAPSFLNRAAPSPRTAPIIYAFNFILYAFISCQGHLGALTQGRKEEYKFIEINN